LNLGLIAILEGNFLEKEFDGVLGLEALGYEFADARSEGVVIGSGAKAGEVIGAFVIAKFARCQAVKGGPSVGIIEQRGQRIIPFTLRARPSFE